MPLVQPSAWPVVTEPVLFIKGLFKDVHIELRGRWTEQSGCT
jgi:hypothetical protein